MNEKEKSRSQLREEARERLRKNPTINQDALDNPPSIDELLKKPLGPTPNCLTITQIHSMVKTSDGCTETAKPNNEHLKDCHECQRNTFVHRKILIESRDIVKTSKQNNILRIFRTLKKLGINPPPGFFDI